MFEFKILAKHNSSRGRLGQFSTPHGKLTTPNLAFVATEGEIKSIPKDVLPTLPVNLIIVNTFHIWTKGIINQIYHLDTGRYQDGTSKYHRSGEIWPIPTIHDYVNLHKPIMSDSGGFQVFSMGFGKAHGVGKIANIFPDEIRKDQKSENQKPDKSDRPENSDLSDLSESPNTDLSDFRSLSNSSDSNNPLKISEEGVEFLFNQQKLLLTPEKSIDLQQQIGADIIFAFDECTSPLNSYEYTKEAMERTHRWLIRCLRQLKKSEIRNPKSELNLNIQNSNKQSVLNLVNSNLDIVSNFEIRASNLIQAIFGIIQGGHYEDLRKKSAKFVGRQNVPGFGIGGSLGRNKKDMHHVLEWVISLLPEEKPRHLLGIGQVRDIFECVERGVDTFDCVIPTREARHQILYTKHGRVNLKKMKNVDEIIEKDCACLACTEKLTYRLLIQLFQLKDPRAYYFSTIHNIQFFTDLMKNIREAIEIKKLSKLKEIYFKFY